MKNILILIAVFLLTISAMSQDKTSGIYFGAIVGTKLNDLNRHFIVDLNPQLYSFSIGAGSAWTKERFVVGFEFLYSSAEKNEQRGLMQYIGFSNTLSLGYSITKSNLWKVEPNIGIVMNNNQLIVQDKSTLVTQNLTNNPFSGNIGLNIKIIDKKRSFYRFKSRLHFSNSWRNHMG